MPKQHQEQHKAKPKKQPEQHKPKQYITSTQLRMRYGGRSTMWIPRIMERDPTFPRPFKPSEKSRLLLWDLDEIEAYERVAMAARDA